MASQPRSVRAIRIPFRRGEIDCAVNLLCQIVGTVVGLVAALNGVLAAPWESSATAEPAGMQAFISEVIYGKIVCGCCVTMIFGNVYYAWMALRMMKKEGRTDVCCVPYGINTPAAFAFVFSIIARAAQQAAAKGEGFEDGIIYAWRAGCVANLVSGLIATVCGFAGPHFAKVAPKASFLIALAGLGFTWLGIGQVIKCFEFGHLGLLPLGVALVGYFGRVNFAPLPIAVVVMLSGMLTGWLSLQGWPEGDVTKLGGTLEAVSASFDHLGAYAPSVMSGETFAVLPQVLLENISVILPVAFVGAVNTLVSVYSAHEAGDRFSIRECLIVDGLTTVVAALFGSPFGTCVFVGHPQYKAQGGRIYYSFINCVAFCFLAATGLFVTVNALIPPFAIAPVILFVGLAINQDAFACIPERHIPAGIIGLFPSVADWIIAEWPHGAEPPEALAALANGAILVSILWTALSVFVVDRKFQHAAAWSCVGAALSAFGLIHQKKADLTFRTFARGAGTGSFGTSPSAFCLGYVTLSVAFGALALLQSLGSGRVPPPCADGGEDWEEERTKDQAMETPAIDSACACTDGSDHGSSTESSGTQDEESELTVGR